MIRTAVTNSAKQEFFQGIHQPGDVYKLALYTVYASFDAETTVYTKAGEVEAKGYVAGGKILDGHKVSLDKGTAIIGFDTAIWEDASIMARGGMIYNSSRENKAIAVFDFGANVTSTNHQFIVKMPPNTWVEGLIRFA